MRKPSDRAYRAALKRLAVKLKLAEAKVDQEFQLQTMLSLDAGDDLLLIARYCLARDLKSKGKK